ncbi:MAG: phosphatidylglycerophosphatase A [Thermoanaerobaculia bacterium]
MGGNQGAGAPLGWRDLFRAAPVSAVVATWFGSGFLPIAPGTWGSLFALPFVEVAYRLAGLAGLGSFAVGVSLAGIPASGIVARLREQEDPSQVVVDEVAGQAISVFPVYALARSAGPLLFWGLVALSFVLFRIVDVVKPGPVGKAESLPGGLGVMADDILGGLFVAAVLAAALLAFR